MFFGPAALLYYLSTLLLAGLTGFILLRRPRAYLSQLFVLLAGSLLLWQVTLFVEVRLASPALQNWIGRANFATVALAAHLALSFVRAVVKLGLPPLPGRARRVRRALTALLVLLTLITPGVSAAERVADGQALTTFGPLFPFYLVHVLGHLIVVLHVAFGLRRRVKNRTVRTQLGLLGWGILGTGGVAAITNVLLPYGFGDFGYCDLGAQSTLLFVIAVAWAVFFHELFDLRLILQKAMVYGVLLALVLGIYSSGLFVVSQYLTSDAGASKPVQFIVLFIAFSFDPLRRFLESRVDELLFGQEDVPGGRLPGQNRARSRPDGRSFLARLFPWQR